MEIWDIWDNSAKFQEGTQDEIITMKLFLNSHKILTLPMLERLKMYNKVQIGEYQCRLRERKSMVGRCNTYFEPNYSEML